MWHSYDYDYYSQFQSEIFWPVFIGVMSVTAVISLVFYIFQSLGLYSIAKRRQLPRAWMAWVPMLNTYLLGKVSDQYQSYAQGRKTNRAAVLLWCSIVTFVVMIPYVLIMVKMMNQMSVWIMDSYTWGDDYYRWSAQPPLGSAMALLGVSLLTLVVGIVSMVFQYIALYDLFRSCEPKNATVFLVIAIFVSAAMPFLVFAVRKKDNGMITPEQQQQRWQQEQAWRMQQWQAQQAWQAQQWQAQQALQAQQAQQWQVHQPWQGQPQQPPYDDPFRQ